MGKIILKLGLGIVIGGIGIYEAVDGAMATKEAVEEWNNKINERKAKKESK